MKLALAAATAALALAGSANAAGLTESLVPGYPDVVGEYLQIPGAQVPGTPKALNTATFLRVRASADGETPRPANAIVVGLPGFSSTPPHWLYLAAQLVHKAGERQCDGAPCRIEVWVLQRRGANLADTTALTAARKASDPKIALDYYLGPKSLQPSVIPGAAPQVGPLPDGGDTGGKWKPFTQGDLAFMADWGFEAYSGDVDAIIGLIKEKSGNRNIFLAGHSQGGGFVANYAARMQADGRRGVEKLSGLIFLDGGPSAGQAAPPTPAEEKAYFDKLAAYRSGKADVYTGERGLLGPIAGPVSAASQSVSGVYYALSDPSAESIFPLRPASFGNGPGTGFLRAIRLTWLARAGTSFDTDPVPGGGLQIPVIQFLGEGLGRIDFMPLPGTETRCDTTPAPLTLGPPGRSLPKPTCVPSAAMVDPGKVYGWVNPSPDGLREAGRAELWLQSNAYAPARSNIRPVTVTLAKTGKATIDASDMIGANWYPSERWDYDANFVGKYKVLKLDRDGVKYDLDKTRIAAIPVYVARQSPAAAMANPFPGVTDYTEITKQGLYQTDPAKALSPFDPAINAGTFFHTDFVSADDSRAGQGLPGEPGINPVSNTLVDWVLKRSKGAATAPTPKALGVKARY